LGGESSDHPAAVFAYGTLEIPEIMRAVSGVLPPSCPARLDGYARGLLVGKSYPGVTERPGAATTGVLYAPVDSVALARLDAFEDDIYERRILHVTTDAGDSVAAFVYVVDSADAEQVSRVPWDACSYPEAERARHLRHVRDWADAPTRPHERMLSLEKYHALGNVYLVVEASDLEAALEAWESSATPGEVAQRLCDRHFGVGSDGLLIRETSAKADVAVRIWNPDGSQAEKSGNGLRIFARYLRDRGESFTLQGAFAVETVGGVVECRVDEAGTSVAVEMGRVTFRSMEIPVSGPDREVLREEIEVAGERLEYSAAGIGNPHCVVLRDRLSIEETVALGPLIETEARFPNRTNVQFAKVRDRRNLEIEIWERGAGRTLASGSSSSATAAVIHRLGLCDPTVTVHMAGGRLEIEISDDYAVRLTGPVTRVASCRVSQEALRHPEGRYSLVRPGG
jgi:diaminopimelate epimerase